MSGSIASVGSGTFTLTGPAGTSTVNWTSTTAFDRTAPAGLAAVAVGACVVVTETAGSDASTGSVDATAVRISAPVAGSCIPSGFGGGAGGQRSGTHARPSGAGGFAGRAVVGTVDSVAGNSFVVDVTTPGSGGASSSTTTTIVDVSTATTYSLTTTAGPADLAVGECARVVDGTRTAAGSGSGTASAAPTTPTGPVTARSVTLSAPVGGSCPTPNLGRRAAGATGSASAGA